MPTKPGARTTKHGALTKKLLEMASTMKPGDRFPSQADLMRTFQVSDRTVLRSLDDLRNAGWIVRRHGSGTYVADPSRPPVARVSAEAPTATTLAAVTLMIGPYYQHCLDLLAGHTQAAGLSLVCQHARDETAFDAVLPLEALNPRGFILFCYHLIPIARRLMDRGHRAVLFGTPPVDVFTDVPCVYADDELGGWMACRHLLSLGHRRIGFLRTDGKDPLEGTLRWKGHQRALNDAARSGAPVTGVVFDKEDEILWRENPAAMAAQFRRPDAPTGIVAWNDFEAVRLLRLLHTAGLRVPDDVSVIGFDRLPIGDECLPALTTIDPHLDAQLRAAMDMLTRASAPAANQATVVVPTLVKRESCGPPRTAS